VNNGALDRLRKFIGFCSVNPLCRGCGETIFGPRFYEIMPDLHAALAALDYEYEHGNELFEENDGEDDPYGLDP